MTDSDSQLQHCYVGQSCVLNSSPIYIQVSLQNYRVNVVESDSILVVVSKYFEVK